MPTNNAKEPGHGQLGDLLALSNSLLLDSRVSFTRFAITAIRHGSGC